MPQYSSSQVSLGMSAEAMLLNTRIEEALKSQIPDSAKAESWYSVLVDLVNDLKKIYNKHPTLCKFILLTAGGMVTVPILLQIAGFGLLGPVEGSFAAWWQSAVGNVVKDSLFSWLQYLGMMPGKAAMTGAVIGFAAFVWVELTKVPESELDGEKTTRQSRRRRLENRRQ
ncbi:hypothetical protein TWF730_010929 [Orbilia blumenaviensis]|uniref:Uncharacterized protein n=1 Tax=Orbilia blumenaviensis TaxID=1796055 RepID=A0AAV9UNE5_9PEZI